MDGLCTAVVCDDLAVETCVDGLCDARDFNAMRTGRVHLCVPPVWAGWHACWH